MTAPTAARGGGVASEHLPQSHINLDERKALPGRMRTREADVQTNGSDRRVITHAGAEAKAQIAGKGPRGCRDIAGIDEEHSAPVLPDALTQFGAHRFDGSAADGVTV